MTALVALTVAGCAGPSPDPTPSPDPGQSGVAERGATAATWTEPHRPRFHFSPPTMWMNDPNGMVHYDGEYHLFYQYHPESMVWGPMHWGHAVSRDLVHWEHLPIALEPDSLGYIFSGSAVVDRDNTTGFGRGGDPPLVAIFTYHDPVRGARGTGDHESQGIAWSNDRGRTWTKYEGNPVLPNPGGEVDFRDPNVFWHEDSRRWIMALSVHDHVQLWGSPDLKNWAYLSAFGEDWGAHGGVWECPDLFPLTDPETGETRWVLILNLNPGGPQGGSGTQYFVGDFDGTTFTLDPEFADTLRAREAVWLDSGPDNYAGVTWADVPEVDGRRIFIGWMSNWEYAQEVPTRPWRSAMTVPRSLRLAATPEGWRVFSTPLRELTALREETVDLDGFEVRERVDLTDRLGFPPTTSEIRLAFMLPDGTRDGTSTGRERTDAGEAARETTFGVVLSNRLGEEFRVGFDTSSGEFFSDRTDAGAHGFSEAFGARIHRAPRVSDEGLLSMRLLIDVASVEVFADGGATVMTQTFFPTEPFDRVAVFATGTPVRVVQGEAHRLRGIWEGAASALPGNVPGEGAFGPG